MFGKTKNPMKTPHAKTIRIGQILKKWTRSSESDRLRVSNGRSLGLWQASGGLAFALALHQVLPGSELYAVWTIPRDAQHLKHNQSETQRRAMWWCIKLDGMFLDANGAQKAQTVEDIWRVGDNDPRLRPITKADMLDWYKQNSAPEYPRFLDDRIKQTAKALKKLLEAS